jgi:hypothetical protein
VSDTEALKQNVELTLRKAEEVLIALEETLTHAGFPAGVDAYRSMADILLGQKLWSAPLRDARLEALFDGIARRAGALVAILAPYTEIMLKLQALAGTQLTAPMAPSQKPTPATPADRIRAALRGISRSQSVTALAEATALPVSEVRKLLGELVESGDVRARTAGGRTVYALAASGQSAPATPHDHLGT